MHFSIRARGKTDNGLSVSDIYDAKVEVSAVPGTAFLPDYYTVTIEIKKCKFEAQDATLHGALAELASKLGLDMPAAMLLARRAIQARAKGVLGMFL